jgi:hypothetical protein|tara:strand:+ start:6889 stop:7323 length:435 start_codon:yes stop_codon:yes gene_type:complete
MNLKEIRKLISVDLKIDETRLDFESLKTPQLHNKYLIIYTDEKLILEKMISDMSILKKNKWLYYTGKMSQEELEFLNWEPFNLNILKTDIDKFISSDKEIIELNHRLILQKEKVNYLESVVKIINNRQWYIRSAIDWVKFTQGI